jgi:glycosyltransferase 2 family protein
MRCFMVGELSAPFWRGLVPWAIGASALVPLALSIVLGLGLRGGDVFTRLLRIVSELPWPALRKRTMRWRDGVVAVDARLAAVARAGWATWVAAAAFLGAWFFEALDTAVVVRLVGGPPSLAFAFASEVGISMVRSMGNIAPAGLGVQDAGYATLLPAMGMTPDVAAAFVLVKRGKELVWIALGYALLAVVRRAESPRASGGLVALRDQLVRLLPRGA